MCPEALLLVSRSTLHLVPGLVLTGVGTALQKQGDKAGTNKMILVTDLMVDADGDVLGVRVL